MAQSGAFSEQVSEAYLVGMLEKISDTKGETKIKVQKLLFDFYQDFVQIIRKRIDSDDDF